MNHREDASFFLERNWFFWIKFAFLTLDLRWNCVWTLGVGWVCKGRSEKWFFWFGNLKTIVEKPLVSYSYKNCLSESRKESVFGHHIVYEVRSPGSMNAPRASHRSSLWIFSWSLIHSPFKQPLKTPSQYINKSPISRPGRIGSMWL